MTELSERVDSCSLSPRERVRVRGNGARISIQMERIPILFEPSSFAPRIRVIP